MSIRCVLCFVFCTLVIFLVDSIVCFASVKVAHKKVKVTTMNAYILALTASSNIALYMHHFLCIASTSARCFKDHVSSEHVAWFMSSKWTYACLTRSSHLIKICLLILTLRCPFKFGKYYKYKTFLQIKAINGCSAVRTLTALNFTAQNLTL